MVHLQDARIYLDVIREFYEAFVIYNFFMYLLLYLEDTYGNVDAFYSTKDDVEHIWGFQYILTPWRMGHEFFWQCKTGVLSYVILRPLMTLTGNSLDLTLQLMQPGLFGFHPTSARRAVRKVDQCTEAGGACDAVMVCAVCVSLEWHTTLPSKGTCQAIPGNHALESRGERETSP